MFKSLHMQFHVMDTAVYFFFFYHTASPCSLTGICAMHIAQLPQTEAVSSGRIHIAIDSYQRAVSQDLKHLPHLDIHLEV